MGTDDSLDNRADGSAGSTGSRGNGLRHRFRNFMQKAARNGNRGGSDDGIPEEGRTTEERAGEDQGVRFEIADAHRRRHIRQGFPGAAPAYRAAVI
ncbi:MAG: hypothetical protein ACTH1D_05550 [Mycobacteriaceae bacterium]|uniref:hypothetical protein n=1 Tax=Corynebacterium sp. TaxID=1720 RepID=UPI003F962A8E